MEVLILVGESTIPRQARLVKKDAIVEATAWINEMRAEEDADLKAQCPDEELPDRGQIVKCGSCIIGDDIIVAILPLD